MTRSGPSNREVTITGSAALRTDSTIARSPASSHEYPPTPPYDPVQGTETSPSFSGERPRGPHPPPEYPSAPGSRGAGRRWTVPRRPLQMSRASLPRVRPASGQADPGEADDAGALMITLTGDPGSGCHRRPPGGSSRIDPAAPLRARPFVSRSCPAIDFERRDRRTGGCRTSAPGLNAWSSPPGFGEGRKEDRPARRRGGRDRG